MITFIEYHDAKTTKIQFKGSYLKFKMCSLYFVITELEKMAIIQADKSEVPQQKVWTGLKL